jgi:hypothetical protein
MRSILTRFRISAHQFEIKTGRYTTPKTPLENRLCKQCNLSEAYSNYYCFLIHTYTKYHRVQDTEDHHCFVIVSRRRNQSLSFNKLL